LLRVKDFDGSCACEYTAWYVYERYKCNPSLQTKNHARFCDNSLTLNVKQALSFNQIEYYNMSNNCCVILFLISHTPKPVACSEVHKIKA
jgi:hypothetical protein